MTVSNAVRKKRIAACVMALALLLLVLISASCLIAEGDHECTGEGCPICACLLRCESVLRRFGAGADAQTTGLMPAVLCLILLVLLTACVFAQKTPVLRKVRLND